jgi:hypothetical protein
VGGRYSKVSVKECRVWLKEGHDNTSLEYPMHCGLQCTTDW